MFAYPLTTVLYTSPKGIGIALSNPLASICKCIPLTPKMPKMGLFPEPVKKIGPSLILS